MLVSVPAYVSTQVCALMIFRESQTRRYPGGILERFGFGAKLERPCLWVHAASVDEVQAAAPLIFHLGSYSPAHTIVVTTFTATGRQHACALFGDRVQVRYLPFDLPGAMHRFFDMISPVTVVIFETELWPNIYYECCKRDVPLVVASARTTPRSVRRYRRLGNLFKDALLYTSVIATQSDEDAARFCALGANRATLLAAN